MTILDNPETYRQLDPAGMLQHLHQFPDQCQRAWQRAIEFSLPKEYAKVDNVVVVGMGGSAIGGDFVRRLAIIENTVPVSVHRDYGLPPFVNRNTLLIFSSYSGNTEETLSSFIESIQTPAKKIAITAGGKLKDLADKERVPTITIDYQAPPRAAFPYSFLSLLGIFHNLRLLQNKADDIREMLQVLQRLEPSILETTPLDSNPAKRLAADLYGRMVIVYGSGMLSEVALRWKGQLNENSKTWAFCEILPELNHNSVVGYQFPSETRRSTMAVLLHSASLHRRVSIRYQFTTEILTNAGIAYRTVEATGQSPLAQMMGLVILGDYVSLYLAMLNRVDPTQVAAIDYLKSRLAGLQ